MLRIRLLLLLLLSLTAPTARAAAPPALENRDDHLGVPLNPEGRYDPRVTAPENFLSYPLGARFTPQPRVVDYLRTLATQAPERALWEPYGETYEGRTLGTLTIASAENRARLEELRADVRRLADPERTSAVAARELADRLPLIVWLSYNIHGNESSPSEAVMAVAYELLAERGAGGLLDSLVVILDPCVNPDGHDRYANWVNGVAGRVADPTMDAREHDEPWPGGRFNHYLFDLNRDWAWQTQIESRLRSIAYLRWRPQVHVDFHEMSPHSHYFFFPAGEPMNTNLPAQVRTWGEIFGRGNSEVFDARGWRYYTGEDFDLYYPGYGDSWPAFQGATGMTYEMAGHGSAGLRALRRDGTILTLRERTRKHFTASMATLRTARAHRFARLLDYHAFFEDGVNGRLQGPATYIIPPGDDPARTAELINLLIDHGARVQRATENVRAAELRDAAGYLVKRDLPAGSYLIPMRQPLRALINTLLEPEATLPETLFYDITAWSLPEAYGVASYWTDSPIRSRREPLIRAEAPEGGVSGGAARVGWLLPWESNGAPKLLGRLLQDGVRAGFATRPFELDGLPCGRGTIVIPADNNVDSLGAHLDRLGRELGVTLHAASTGQSGGGIDLGSDHVLPLKPPKIAVVAGEGIDATSFGAVWFLLDRQYEIPHTVLPLAGLNHANLAAFNVLIFPDDQSSGDGSGYSAMVDSSTVVRIRRWIEAGGVFVGLQGGAGWASKNNAGLSRVTLKSADEDTASGDDKEARDLARRLSTTEAREKQDRLLSVPGTILRVKLDPTHPLAFGYSGEIRVLKTSRTLFELGDDVRNVGWYPESSRVSGYLAEKTEDALTHTAFLTEESLGRGHLVLYNADPNFRLFWYGLNRLFLNSLVFTGSY